MSRDIPNSVELPQARPAAAARPIRIGLAVAAFAALTALGARIAVPLPGTAVPFTLQPLVVLLAGALLGAGAGAASQFLYLGAGAAGLPVFAAGGGAAYLLGPTGGYLLAFAPAAAVAGLLAGRGGALRTAGGLVVALAVIHAGGLAWLAATGDAATAWRAGSAPFWAGDVLKIALATVLTLALRGPIRDRLR